MNEEQGIEDLRQQTSACFKWLRHISHVAVDNLTEALESVDTP